MTPRHLTPFLLCAAALAGQENTTQLKPPPEVDEALRARVHAFYQAHVDGKFRQAETLVAEEAKDDFFAMGKTQYENCQTLSVQYSENFSRAKVTEGCKTTRNIHGASFPVTWPIHSDWKVEDGQWFWFLPPVTEVQTPFGPKKVYKSGEEPSSASKPLPQIDPLALAKDILKQVQIDKTEVTFRPDQAGTAEVKLKNGMPGAIRFTVHSDAPIPGLSLRVPKEELGAGETATIVLDYKPESKLARPVVNVNIRIEQTSQVLSFAIRFMNAAGR